MARKAMRVWPLLLAAAVLLVLVFSPGGQADPGPKRFDRFTVFNMTNTPVTAEVTLLRKDMPPKAISVTVPKMSFAGSAPYQPWGVTEIRCKIGSEPPRVIKRNSGSEWLISATFTWDEYTKEDGVKVNNLCGEALQGDWKVLTNDP